MKDLEPGDTVELMLRGQKRTGELAKVVRVVDERHLEVSAPSSLPDGFKPVGGMISFVYERELVQAVL